jgi:hypothetical protein
MTVYGYARVSTDGQTLAAQEAPAGRRGKSDKGTHTLFPDSLRHVRKTLCRSALQGIAATGRWPRRDGLKVLGRAYDESGPTQSPASQPAMPAQKSRFASLAPGRHGEC